MQELLVPDFTTYPTDSFDGHLVKMHAAEEGVAVVLLHRIDENGKNLWMVGERYLNDDMGWYITNVKEFRHASDRAERYFAKRRAELGI